MQASHVTIFLFCILSSAHIYAQSIDEQIRQVTSNLQASVVVKGAPEKRQTLADSMARYKVPGVSIALIHDGKLAWAQGFGVKAADSREAVSTTTLFQAASISKPVTATAMLKLVEQGQLSLDAPINTYLTSWQLPYNEFTKIEAVTLRRLASHSAGLNVHGFPGYASGKPLPTVPQILDGKAPANTGAVRVEMTPGSVWKYSGGGTTIMQLAMMDKTSVAFPDLMKRLVLEPIGMSNSTYEQPLPQAKQDFEAAGHDEEGKVIQGRWHTYPELAAAGLWTTPRDLSKWAIEIAEARAGKANKILSQTIATEMLTVQKAATGLGPNIHNVGDAMYFEHGGSNFGYRCFIVYFPNIGRGAAIMTNGEGGAFVYRQLLGALANMYDWPDFKPKVIETIALDTSLAQQVAGEYPFPPASATDTPPSVFVTYEMNQLMIEVPKILPKTEAVMQANGVLITPENGFEWKFTKAKDGGISAIEFNGRRLAKKLQ